ncbi:hypothetical protein [Plantibacter sp. Leaf314]|uniref:hypothetical protein n=1 Tax=Plantibacter sp. Leaf314 TaxID=1736333 RepID=UPI0006FB1ED0|nr:hypothetical protein [Plantibacter sp. Leaf314]KQQ49681.1 hypothetical protein ASF68_17735 [Plantibacter sp. Leaf314]
MNDSATTPVSTDLDPDASVDDLLAEADTLPCGPAERALLDEALRRADAAGDEEAAYATRMRLTQSAHMTGDTDTMFSSFGWCVGKHDADPQRFPITVDGCDLLFQYKWMAGRLSTNPTFSLAQIEAMHQDMQARYAAAGATMSGVVQSQFHIATVTGRLDEAATLLERRSSIEDDRYSHCEACVRNEDAWFHQLRGHDEEAIRIYDEMFENRMSCGEEPETSEAQALLPYLRAGRLDDAKAAHQRSYRVARSNADGFGIIADHLIFCAVTGNEARGLAMLERHLPTLVNDPINLSGHTDGLTAVGVLLDAVTRAGHGGLPVRGADAPELARYLGVAPADATDGAPRDDADWTVAAIAERAWASAERLARAFDERNGNDFRTARLEAARALATEHWDLPLSVEGFAAPVVEPEPAASAAEWRERTSALLQSADTTGAIVAAEQGLALLADESDPDENLRAGLFGVITQAAVIEGDEGRAGTAWTDRGIALRAAGRNAVAELEGRFGPALLGTATEDRLTALLAELDEARLVPVDPDRLIHTLVITARHAFELAGQQTEQEAAERFMGIADRLAGEAVLAAAVDDPGEAGPPARLLHAHLFAVTGRIQEAEELLDPLLEPGQRASVRLPALTLRTRMLGGAGAFAEGVALADELVGLQTTLGNRLGIIQACTLSAALLSDADRDREAAARMQLAITHARRAEVEDVDSLTLQLARYLQFAGDAATALEHYDEVYQARREQAAPGELADLLANMGEAARMIGEHGMAYGVWRAALDDAAAVGNDQVVIRTGFGLSTLLLQFEDDDAVEVVDQALAAARRLEDPQLLVQALQRAASARAAFGDDTGLPWFEEARGLATAHEAAWLVADITDSEARALGALGRADDATATARRAAAGFVAAGDENGAAVAEVFGARSRAAVDDHLGAVELFRSARGRLPAGSPDWTTVTAELADAHERLEQHTDAALLRAEIEE